MLNNDIKCVNDYLDSVEKILEDKQFTEINPSLAYAFIPHAVIYIPMPLRLIYNTINKKEHRKQALICYGRATELIRMTDSELKKAENERKEALLSVKEALKNIIKCLKEAYNL